jgi:hypothetical protein
MNWTTILVIAAIVAAIFMIKKSGQISAKDAVEKLRNGALVIDVRSAGEFSSGHLASRCTQNKKDAPPSGYSTNGYGRCQAQRVSSCFPSLAAAMPTK